MHALICENVAVLQYDFHQHRKKEKRIRENENGIAVTVDDIFEFSNNYRVFAECEQ
jgi:hypothetical protein